MKRREPIMAAALCIRKRGSRPAAAAVERGIAGELTSGVAAGDRVRAKAASGPGQDDSARKTLDARGRKASYAAGNPASAGPPEEGGIFWDHDRPAAASKGDVSGLYSIFRIWMDHNQVISRWLARAEKGLIPTDAARRAGEVFFLRRLSRCPLRGIPRPPFVS